MKTRRGMTVCGAIVALYAFTPALAESAPAHGARSHHQSRADGRAHREAPIGFSTRDAYAIQRYYAPRYRRLPPGLQKKLRRTGRLPPGWQKRFEPFPLVLERQLVVLPSGYRRGVIDGHAVIVNPRTRVIIDLAALF